MGLYLVRMLRKCFKYFVIAILLFSACSRKHEPAGGNTVVYRKGPWPATIKVDDRVAGHSLDGRLYYDLDGKRYWKNYKDGKNYLYSQKMYGTPDFQPTHKH